MKILKKPWKKSNYTLQRELIENSDIYPLRIKVGTGKYSNNPSGRNVTAKLKSNDEG